MTWYADGMCRDVHMCVCACSCWVLPLCQANIVWMSLAFVLMPWQPLDVASILQLCRFDIPWEHHECINEATCTHTPFVQTSHTNTCTHVTHTLRAQVGQKVLSWREPVFCCFGCIPYTCFSRQRQQHAREHSWVAHAMNNKDRSFSWGFPCHPHNTHNS